MLSILFTKIPDQVPRKSPSDSEDMQKVSKGAPTIFRKHMPWGIGIESLGMIGCIFAENGPLEGGIESNSGVPAGVLRVISDGFLASIRAFSKGAPHHFPKARALRYGHKKFGNDRMYIRGEWALRRWHWIEFWGTGGGAKGDFRWIFSLNPCIFEGGPHHFPKAHALRYGHRKFGNDHMYIRGEWALRRWHRMKFEWYRPRC